MMNKEKSDALYIFASAFAQGHWTLLSQLALDYQRDGDYRLERSKRFLCGTLHFSCQAGAIHT
jgi:hypothetical protein